MAAEPNDVAQLAIYRLLWLQRETRSSVRGRRPEAAAMLARSSIETLIVGLYCLHEPNAVVELQGENVRLLKLLLRYLSEERLTPPDVLDECIKRLDIGPSKKGPSVEAMAATIDKATGGKDAIGLYDRFYRPAASLTVHASGLALMRHVRMDDTLTKRPGRVWLRRSPTRIADACLGILTAAVGREEGQPSVEAGRYARRHLYRALTPVAVIAWPGMSRTLRPREIVSTIGTMISIGRYVWSGTDSDDLDRRASTIGDAMSGLLLVATDDTQATAALYPAVRHLAARLAASSAEAE
jgi:hypothetical protein